jgi:hypothetical protein
MRTLHNEPPVVLRCWLRTLNSMSDWLSAFFAGLAVLVSAGTWFAQRRYPSATESRADVSVSFHWLTARARVVVPGREPLHAGYHLVLENRGPALATNVNLVVRNADGAELKLLDVAKGEFPLPRLDAGVRYPIPWMYEPFTRHARRFLVSVSWNDQAGWVS